MPTGPGCPGYRALVIGIGNLLMSDDGVGVRAIQQLLQQELPPGIAALVVGTGAIKYLDEISRAETLVAVDAVRGNGPPGTIYRITDLTQLAKIRQKEIDCHTCDLSTIITWARALSGIPTVVILYGLEPFNIAPGCTLSPPVQEALPRLLSLLLEEIVELCAPGR